MIFEDQCVLKKNMLIFQYLFSKLYQYFEPKKMNYFLVGLSLFFIVT